MGIHEPPILAELPPKSPEPNMPGVFTATKWFIDKIDDARLYGGLLAEKDDLGTFYEPLNSIDQLHEDKDMSPSSLPTIMQRHWRNVGLMEAARKDRSTSSEDKRLVWDLVSSKAAINTFQTLSGMPVTYQVWRYNHTAKRITSAELDTVREDARINFDSILRDITGEGAKPKKSVRYSWFSRTLLRRTLSGTE